MCVARDGLGQAIAFHIGDADIRKPLRHRRRHRRAAAAQAADRGQIVLVDVGIQEKILNHRGNRGPARDLVALDALRGDFAIPARQQHHGIADEQRPVHAALHAGDVEHRRHGQQRHFGLQGEPLHAAHRGVHDRAVRVHAALGLPGGAGGIRHHAQIVRSRGQRAGRQDWPPAHPSTASAPAPCSRCAARR